jgi:hypothetical protein
MPRGLRRYHESGHSHFVTFGCYRRQPNFDGEEICGFFPECLKRMRQCFAQAPTSPSLGQAMAEPFDYAQGRLWGTRPAANHE